MGNNILSLGQSNEQANQKYLQNLNYVTQTKTPSFGYVKIYRMKEKPYEYVMCKMYSAMHDDPSIKNRKQNYEKNLENKSIISIDAVDFKTVRQTCGKHINLSIYCRYYFYTLEEAILKKMKKMYRFPEQEVLYILKTLISLYETFHLNDQKEQGIFKPSNFFLTPEGFLKIYPWINEWREEQSQQSISMKNNLFNIYNQTQVQLSLSKKKKDEKKMLTGNDIEDIGIILLCVIFLAKESDYRTAGEDIKYEIVRFVINSYNQSENKNLAIFRNLLKGIFENKWHIQQIKKEVQCLTTSHEFKNSIRIKIVTNQNQDSDSTINGQGLQKQRESRLQMMPKSHLVPGRIRCYSSKLSSSVHYD